uniref:F-box domain-containing protein n=1 Tax=Meloidogyne hapla TaxID=6305 RepID=A0A1I8BLJ8_MELHA
MINLPPETWLDIFKFINYNQLCNLRLTERFFLKLIDEHKNELALKEFYSFELDRVGHDYMNNWEKAKDIYKDMIFKFGHGFINLFEPDEKLIKKWNTALSENIPLFLPDMFTRLKPSEYIIVITKKERDPYNQRIRLSLPHFPERIGQLIFIRYWLEQLSFCSFKSSFNYCDCYFAIFNPKMLKLIFEEINFYTKIAGLHIAKNDLEFNKQAIEFISKYLIVTKCLYLCIGNNYEENIIKYILNNGKKFNKISFCINTPSSLIDTIIQ